MMTTESNYFDDATLSPSPEVAPADAASVSEDHLQSMERRGRLVWTQISRSHEFREKYGRDMSDPGVVQCYMFTRQARIDTFAFEAFAAVRDTSIMTEELVFHPMFEQLIQRYTKTRSKPNPVLMETRSTDFCYRLTILVEAVPQHRRIQRPELRLVREFAVLHHVWERFSKELGGNLTPPDFLVGVPMPFEFVNVVGNQDYDFGNQHGMWHKGLHGEEMQLSKLVVPGGTTGIGSTLSYLAMEKLGPTVQYMLELLKSQRRNMSLSTALKIFDQLLCRLMVLHKYGIILGNLDTKFLNFGVREAAKVLYISRFDCAVVAPTQHRSTGPYSDRCAPLATLKRREVHFVNDIESAFYIFLSLIFPVLPWDGTRLATLDSSSTESCPTTLTSGRSTGLQVDEKANFWSSSSWFNRMLRHVNFEFPDPVYQGFTVDLLTMLYSKTQEAMVQCEAIPQAEYMSLLLTPSSPANNAYSSLRRIIATYFRFERLSSITKDPVCWRKVELLLVEDPEDRRLLWNLNDWCWNAFFPSYASSKSRAVSVVY